MNGDEPRTPYPATQEHPDMSDNQSLWPDANQHTDPTAAFEVRDALAAPADAEPPHTPALPHLPQQPAPYRVEPATAVPDDRVPNEELRPQYGTSRPSPTGWPSAPPRPLVTVVSGPRPATVLFGLVCVLAAAYALVTNLGGADLDLRSHLPAIVGAAGALLLLVGLVGLVVGRRRR